MEKLYQKIKKYFYLSSNFRLARSGLTPRFMLADLYGLCRLFPFNNFYFLNFFFQKQLLDLKLEKRKR